MKSKFYLLGGMGLVALTAGAQQLKPEYIQWPSSSDFPTYVNQWTPGTPLFEDENFFISRVKPRPYISNPAVQVDPTITPDNDKKLLFWVPVGNTNLNGVHTNALPNSIFDSEVFSTWSYVTHYGNWTSPHGWVPGGFADAAHKHGTVVSGVASIPWGSLSGSWLACLNAQSKLDVDKTAQFLYYHGVDGLGYNSEFSGASNTLRKIRDLHAGLMRWMKEKNPKFENVWYDGTNDRGSISFDQGVGSHNAQTFGDGENPRVSLFLNYNWNSRSTINSTTEYVRNMGRDIKDVYAGHNMQGGQPALSWTLLKECGYSIGLWGAHDFNYLWAPRSSEGSSYEAKQRTYQKGLEQWFSNGNQNPADRIEIVDPGTFGPRPDFFGMSAMMTARSAMGWDLGEEPMVTYFNLGNGKFFNLEGQQANDRAWYSLGIQDYMPTWRWWFSSKFLSGEKADVPASGLKAEFTWDDAWFGGSCLNIKGSTGDEYLHLFRTKYLLKRDDQITVRYKLINGSANINLALSKVGAETSIVRESNLSVLKADDASDSDVWVEKTFKISGPLGTFNDSELAVIALHFTEAQNLDLLLGEISIVRGEYPTPAAPEITKAELLANNYKGVDAKVIFNMANQKAAGEPVYNLDVAASMYRVYTQQEGEEPVMMGATTSWAHVVYQAPTNLESMSPVRVGVQAVSLDQKSASEIAWSDYMELPEYVTNSEIQIDKAAIKPGEAFEISFVDPKQPAANWQILNSDGQVLAESNGTAISMPEGLPTVGGYDVVVFAGTEASRRYGYFIQISDWDKGALPLIEGLTVNGEEAADKAVAIEINKAVNLGYTGRQADGTSSRGIAINLGFVGVPLSDRTTDQGTTIKGIDLKANESFGVGAWLKFDLPKGTSNFFQIEDRTGSWPSNNWGWCWLNIAEDGTLDVTFRTSSNGGSPELSYKYPEGIITPNAWTHAAMSFEQADGKFLFRLFVNGKEVPAVSYTSDKASGNWQAGPAQPMARNYPVNTSDWLSFGGGRGSEPIYNDGIVDEMVIWNGAITEEDVEKAMNGYGEAEVPENVNAYWSFENDANADNHCFASRGTSGGEVSQFALVKSSGEGQAKQTPTNPIYEAGSPFVPGTAYKIVTLPSWSGRKMAVGDAQGNDTAGSANVSFSTEGDHIATLTLTNDYGTDSKEYPVLSTTNAIAGIAADGTVNAYTVEDAVIVAFEEAGDYAVKVYDITGATVAAKSAAMASGDSMTLRVNASGVYMVVITRDGAPLRTFKLLKK